MESPEPERGAIAFAEKLLALLDQGAFTSTYKYAVLLGLLDVCMERSTHTGAAPESITTRQLARKVLELYWSHSVAYDPGAEVVLRQNQPARGGAGGQAEIIQAILRFRARHAPDPSAPLARAEAHALRPFAALTRHIEWKLVEMPLPRLQWMGAAEDRFIYQIEWDKRIRKREFDDEAAFSNVLRFVGRASEYLVQLAGLLRPLIQRQWAMMVARYNQAIIPDARLEQFLFGAERIDLGPVRAPLRELHDNRCFYCGRAIRGPAHVDHFIPWARCPDNGIENLVIADERCNSGKSDHLAAPVHVDAWAANLRDRGDALARIAADSQWERHPERSLGVARAIYLRLPDDAMLWQATRQFVHPDRPRLLGALGS